MNEIENKKLNIYGWKMRIMQCEEDIYAIEKRMEQFKSILKGQEEDLQELEKENSK
jgi:hypothetical protein